MTFLLLSVIYLVCSNACISSSRFWSPLIRGFHVTSPWGRCHRVNSRGSVFSECIKRTMLDVGTCCGDTYCPSSCWAWPYSSHIAGTAAMSIFILIFYKMSGREIPHFLVPSEQVDIKNIFWRTIRFTGWQKDQISMHLFFDTTPVWLNKHLILFEVHADDLVQFWTPGTARVLLTLVWSLPQGLPVVSHLQPGVLWRSGRLYDWRRLVLFHTRDADTIIPQNSSVVRSALISWPPPGVTGEDESSSAWISGSNESVMATCIICPLNVFLIYRPISEYFLVRDTSLIPNILWFEYTVTRSEAR